MREAVLFLGMAREALANLPESFPTELPRMHADIIEATILIQSGRPQEAVTSLEKWREHPQLNTCSGLATRLYGTLGNAYGQAHRFREALELFQRMVTTIASSDSEPADTSSQLGDEAPNISLVLAGNMAQTLAWLGQLNEAEALALSALQIAEPRGHDEARAVLCHALGVICSRIAVRHSEAVEWYNKALAIVEKTHSFNPHRRGALYNNLGQVLKDMGQ